MVLFNYALKELTAKIVYYGPGLSGKTTNLQYIYEELPIKNKGRMLTLATETDRTLYFDFLPVDAGVVRGIKTRVQLYTVPGQVFYNATRRMVLKGADGVVFVADSQKSMMEANEESLENLRDNLVAHDLQLEEMPMVMQFNKRDLDDTCTIEEMNEVINDLNAPFYEAVAKDGVGVEDTLQAISSLVLKSVIDRYGGERNMNPMGQLEKTARDVNEGDPDEGVPASAFPDTDSVPPGEVTPPSVSVPPSLKSSAPVNSGGPAVQTMETDPSNAPFESLNIEGMLDDALSLDEPEPEPAMLPTNPSPLPPSTTDPGSPVSPVGPSAAAASRASAESDAMFSGLLDDSFGVEKTESILGDGVVPEESFVKMPSEGAFNSNPDLKPLDNFEADFDGDSLEPLGDISGASLSELIKTKVSVPEIMKRAAMKKPEAKDASGMPSVAPRSTPSPRSSEAASPRARQIEVPVTVELDADTEEQEVELLLKIRFKRK